MKLYVKVSLAILVAFAVMFVTLGILKSNFVDPSRDTYLREAHAPALDLAAREIAASSNRDATLQQMRSVFASPLELAPRDGRPAAGWFERDDEMYLFREVDRSHVLVLGPIHHFDPRSTLGLAILIASTLFLTIVVAYVLIAPPARRIRALAAATQQLANRNFTVRSADRNNDVIGELARHFNDMAAQIEKLVAAKQLLLQAVSHEFRTPLSRIRFELQLLEESTTSAERERRFAAIDESLIELDDLVGELLAYTRDGRRMKLVLEEVSPAEIAREVARTLQPLRSEIIVRVDAHTLTTVYAHPKYLRRAIQNLVVNAVRHAHTEVVVVVDEREREIAVTIRDDGAGIPEEARERIFEPFVRLDESRSRDDGGTGLGLAIVRRICEWHGGSVVVEPCPVGTKFVLTLPRTRSTAVVDD